MGGDLISSVNTVRASGSSVFLMGRFDGVSGQSNANIAEVEAVTVGVPEPP